MQRDSSSRPSDDRSGPLSTKGHAMQKPSTDTGRFVLTLSAASERGQVAAITAMLERHGAYVEEFAVFDDVLSSRFYVRAVFRLDGGTPRDIEALRRAYEAVVNGFEQA